LRRAANRAINIFVFFDLQQKDTMYKNILNRLNTKTERRKYLVSPERKIVLGFYSFAAQSISILKYYINQPL